MTEENSIPNRSQKDKDYLHRGKIEAGLINSTPPPPKSSTIDSDLISSIESLTQAINALQDRVKALENRVSDLE